METPLDDPKLRLRLSYAAGLTLGPGKADLLDLIRETGSIAAAGRAMSMSYKRAWSLVEEMNAAFVEPLVESNRGGSKGGGARLTETGEQVLALFRTIEDKARDAAATEISALHTLLIDMSGRK